MSLMTEDSNRVFHRAMQWLSDLQDAKADSAALFRWLAESPRHVEEFSLALTLTDEIAGLTKEQCAGIAALNRAQREVENVVPLNIGRAVAAGSMANEADKPPRARKFLAAAAILLGLLIGGGFFWWDNGWRSYATDFGEQRIVELSDGSTVHLNTESRVKVKYGEASRDIRLIAGEALFKVQRDPVHPFRVYADGNVIQAVGTQFNVYRRATSTTVAVLEGSVRITPEVEASRRPAMGTGAAAIATIENLSAGQEAQIVPRRRIVMRPINVTQAAVWRQHRLVFRNDTLADIAAEFNRYNRRPQIRIQDARAGARRFAATFDADAPEALLQVLETNADLKVEQSEDEIRVGSRAMAEMAAGGQSTK